MDNLSKIFIGLVIAIHLYIFYFEMFAWNTIGKKAFGKKIPVELFSYTKGLAANQGLYNLFLAGGLIWSFFIDDLIWQRNVATFFLVCVAVAGLYGGITASKKIFTVQLAPAGIALICLWLL